MTPPLTRRQLLKGLGVAAGAAVAAPVLAACGESAATSTAAKGNQKITTCVYAKNHASSPLFWQQFAPDGITVDVKIVTSGAQVQTGLESGDLDFGLMGPYNTLLAQQQQGINSKIICMTARGGVGLVARPGIGGVADLRGKKIAVPSPGIQVLVLNYLMAQAGLSLDSDVEAVPLAYADQPVALERGDVDAYIGTEPLCTRSVVDGAGVRIGDVTASPAGDLNTAMWASPAMLANPDLCRAASLMQKKATEYLSPNGTNDPQVWKTLLVDQFGYTEPVYQAVLPYIGAVWTFDETRVAQVKGAGTLMQQQGVLAKEPDYEALFARDYWTV